MKVLFVASGNSKNGITPIIKNQGDSLVKFIYTDVSYYAIKGHGILGYLRNVKSLKKVIKDGQYDVIHAHFSLSAIVASLSGANNLVVSLMGCDVNKSASNRIIIKILRLLFHWQHMIVKSIPMKNLLGIDNVYIIPNGVDLDRFKSLDKLECQTKLGWNPNKKHILFAAEKSRPEKNFGLAQTAIDKLNNPNIILHSLNNVNNEDMPCYYNAADVVILSSLREGSPNVIKEALACNRPIVTTNVGDVEWLINGIDGCYVSSFDVEEYSSCVSHALQFDTTKSPDFGKKRIIEYKLDSKSIATEIASIYQTITE